MDFTKTVNVLFSINHMHSDMPSLPDIPVKIQEILNRFINVLLNDRYLISQGGFSCGEVISGTMPQDDDHATYSSLVKVTYPINEITHFFGLMIKAFEDAKKTFRAMSWDEKLSFTLDSMSLDCTWSYYRYDDYDNQTLNDLISENLSFNQVFPNRFEDAAKALTN